MFSRFDLESSMIGQTNWFYMLVTLLILELILFDKKNLKIPYGAHFQICDNFRCYHFVMDLEENR